MAGISEVALMSGLGELGLTPSKSNTGGRRIRREGMAEWGFKVDLQEYGDEACAKSGCEGVDRSMVFLLEVSILSEISLRTTILGILPSPLVPSNPAEITFSISIEILLLLDSLLSINSVSPLCSFSSRTS